MRPLITSTKRTRIYEQTEMLFVLFSRELNFWAIFVSFQYFTHFAGQTNGKIERVKSHLGTWHGVTSS